MQLGKQIFQTVRTGVLGAAGLASLRAGRATEANGSRRDLTASATNRSGFSMPPSELLGIMDGFSKRPKDEQVEIVISMGKGLSTAIEGLRDEDAFPVVRNWSEAVVGVNAIPLSLVPVMMDGEGHLIPFSTTEPSVVASAYRGSVKLAGLNGITTTAARPLMWSQVMLCSHTATGVDQMRTEHLIMEHKNELMALADSFMPNMVERGGGMRNLRVRTLPAKDNFNTPMMSVDFQINVREAMGANAVTKLAEEMQDPLSKLTGWNAEVGILSNMAMDRLATAEIRVPIERLATKTLSGREVAERILRNDEWAERDPLRRATSRKGTDNGHTAVVLATGNDVQAFQAAQEAYHMERGRSTRWQIEGDELVGRTEIPTPAGTVGTSLTPQTKAVIRSVVPDTKTLSRMIAISGGIVHLPGLDAMARRNLMKGHLSHDHRNR